ncbi:MAG TPA: ATP-dependent zinc metalloprotease FtsH [Steroidobacteraceae bacterium]|nr:ATP-dependent zinc metalloprotease FtsH [Steroidobacteraceae bacterium]
MPKDAAERGFWIFAGGVIAALLAIAAINFYKAKHAIAAPAEFSYSRFLDEVEHGTVRSVALAGHEVQGTLADHSRFRSYAADDPDLIRLLRQKGVAIQVYEAPAGNPSWVSVVTALSPLVILLLLILLFARRMPGWFGGLGGSRARRLAPERGRVTFADVAGVDEARQSLQEIVDFLREPQTFKRLGGRIPHGVLLVGPPGTGKTLLARAIAGEANVPFFTISGSDFVEMFVGVGASRVRAMFEQAKKSAPCIIFMDEIDAVGRRRGAGLGGGNDEREQTLNQLLVEMDGFESKEGVILIAATNRPDVLDPALRRPGRFDREIIVANPDILGREQILAVHARAVPLETDVDLAQIARRTPGFSGADLMNLVNEAALLAARRAKQAVGMAELEDARDTVTMGAERRTHVMTEDERRLTACREGGRAIVALLVPAADPIHKATIITRGSTTGMVRQLPENDQLALTLEQMKSRLAVLLAGRAAEEMLVGPSRITSGTARDIEEATRLARSMVTRWGLSESLGPVVYGEDQDEVFLGHSITRQQTISPDIAQVIAAEVRRLIEAALQVARDILGSHRAGLDEVVRQLLLQETLTGEEIRALVAGSGRG